MKLNIFKQIAVALMLAMTVVVGYGATITYSPSGAATNTVFSGTSQTNRGGAIRQITFANSGAAVTVRLLDAPATSITYSNAAGAWTNQTRTVVQHTNVYEDILGNSVTNVYTQITNTIAAASAATNSYRALGQWVIGSNVTQVIDYDVPLVFGLGLLATNNGAVSITINYQQF